MKALRFHEGLSTVVEEVARPEPGPGEVLLRVTAAGFCHTDIDILHGRYPASFPRIPGHEFSGVVEAVGEGVDAAMVGRLVAVDPLLSCGECRNCRRGYLNLCATVRAYGADLDGGMAQHAVVAAANAHDATGLSPLVAAMAEPFACVLNAIQRSGMVAGDTVAVIGAGPIGMMMGVLLSTLGAAEVVVYDIAAERLARAERYGFTRTVLVESDVESAAAGARYDVVFDATGRPAVVQQAIRLLEDAGTLVPFGVCPPGSEIRIDPNEVYARQLRIIGSFSLHGTVPDAVALLQRTVYDVESLVTHRFSLDEAADGVRTIGSPDSLKVQIVF